MIRFKQFIAEIFDGKGARTKKHDASEMISLTFKVGRYSYILDMYPVKNNDGTTIWSIGFSNMDLDDEGMELHGKFNTAQALKVYTTVISNVRKYLPPKLNKGDIIEFSAADPRTNKLYAKFTNMIASEIKGTVIKSPAGEFRIIKN